MQSQPDVDVFRQPIAPGTPGTNPINADGGKIIVVDGSKIRFTVGDKKKCFDIIDKDRTVIDSVLDPTWIPQNPDAEPEDKLAVEKAKIEGAKLRADFWNQNFRSPFNIFDEIQKGCPMNYFFVPLNKLLTVKQNGILTRDWQIATSTKGKNESLYALFDRTKTPQFSGKFQIFETQV